MCTSMRTVADIAGVFFGLFFGLGQICRKATIGVTRGYFSFPCWTLCNPTYIYSNDTECQRQSKKDNARQKRSSGYEYVKSVHVPPLL